MIYAGEKCTHKDEHYSIGAPMTTSSQRFDSSDFAAAPLETLPPPRQFHFRPPMQGTRDRAFSQRPWQRRIELYPLYSNMIFVPCLSSFVILCTVTETDLLDSHWYSFWLLDFIFSISSRVCTTNIDLKVHRGQTKHKYQPES
jgi:hypothetical protein